MSPLWKPRSLKLYLTPHSLNGIQVSAWKKQVQAAGAVPVNSAKLDLSTALQALPLAGSVSELIVSDAWLRYLVLDWPLGISKPDELAAYVKGGFAEVYGSQWQVIWQIATPGYPLLVCGMPLVLQTQIESVWPKNKPDTQPLFSAVLQSIPAALRRSMQQLLILEEGYMTLALGQQQSWLSVTNLAWTPDALPLLVARIRQEQAAVGLSNSIPIYCLSLDKIPTQLTQSGMSIFDLREHLPADWAPLLRSGLCI